MTHMLTGAVLARTGFHRKAAYATFAMLFAAEFPDIDMLWSFAGPLTGFMHHRGITHTLVAAPFEAGLILGGCYLFHRLRKGVPMRWAWLYGGVLLALLSHLLLDWTNNYGVRPFFPFDPHWYAGSFVFIFEPVLFALLVAALVLPGLFSLINAEVGTRRQTFVSPGWSWTALLLVAALYLFRFHEHAVAEQVTAANTPAATRVFASPHPLDPFTWSTVVETSETYQLGTVNTSSGLIDLPLPADTLYKPPTTLALLAAKRTELGRIYLDWSSFPVLTENQDNLDPHRPLTQIVFSDARFMYDASFLHGRERPPLSGSVLLDMVAPEGQRVVETKFDGREQK